MYALSFPTPASHKDATIWEEMIPCFGIGFEDRIFLHSLPQGNIGKTRSEQCAIKTSPWRHVLLSHQCHCILTPSCPLRELSDRQTESQMFSCYTTLVISHVWTYRLLRSHNAICQYRIFIKIPPIYSLHWLNATTIDIYHKMTQNKSLCHRSILFCILFILRTPFSRHSEGNRFGHLIGPSLKPNSYWNSW